MAKWLVKTEPDDYSFDDLVRDRKTIWNGVNNNLALKYLRQIKKNDSLMIYHTGAEKAIVGLATAVSDAYADPDGGSDKQAVVDIRAGAKLSSAVTLATVKAQPRLAQWELPRLGRLSVMPVPEEYWKIVLAMAESTK
ncbi:MAG: EVE domain-containing protein [Phycisphaerae bacterium]